MKAVQFATYGDPDVLKLVDVDPPTADAGDIRIAVKAAGVNAMDWKIRSGAMKDMMPRDLPSGTGIDAAGIVDQVGDGVTDVSVGDAVFGQGKSTFAEQAVLTAWAKKPDGMSFEEAAGLPMAVETAIRILDQVGVRPGQTLLVSGASGGVGSAAIQIAVARGIRVIGTASAKHQDYVAGLGAEATTYGDGMVDRVRALAPDGIDAALDIAGAGVIPDLIALTGDPAKVLSIADFSAPQHGAQVSSQGKNRAQAFEEAAKLYREGKLTMRVEQTFPLADASKAQTASEAGHVAGRFIVTL